MEGYGSWLNRFDESEGERGWEGRTAGTGPGGLEGRWGSNCCRAKRLGLGGKGGGKCYEGRIWRLEGEMELGWGLSGQVRCREGGEALG